MNRKWSLVVQRRRPCSVRRNMTPHDVQRYDEGHAWHDPRDLAQLVDDDEVYCYAGKLRRPEKPYARRYVQIHDERR